MKIKSYIDKIWEIVNQIGSEDTHYKEKDKKYTTIIQMITAFKDTLSDGEYTKYESQLVFLRDRLQYLIQR